MRPWAGVVVVASIGGLALAACFDFGATMAGGPLEDGGASARDAGSHDAGSSEDAHADGGSDAGSDGGATTFCASLPADAGVVLCDDFDEPNTLPGIYFPVQGDTWGTLTLTDASALSPPSSVDEKTMPLDDGGVIDLALRDDGIAVPALPATMTFAFALSPVQIDPTPGAAIVLGAIDFLDGANNRYSVGLAINVASGLPALALDEQSGFADGGSSNVPHVVLAADAPNMNAWNDIVITIVWTAPTTATASVTINGNAGLSSLALTMTVTAASLQVGIGTSYVTQPAPVWELLYDNVWFGIR